MKRNFLNESLAAIREATTHADVDRIYAQRITALIFDGGTMPDLRRLAKAWSDRHQELLNEAIGDDE